MEGKAASGIEPRTQETCSHPQAANLGEKSFMSLPETPPEGDAWDEGIQRLLDSGLDAELRRKFNMTHDANGTTTLEVQVSAPEQRAIVEACHHYLLRLRLPYSEMRRLFIRMVTAFVLAEAVEPIRRSLEAEGVVWPLAAEDLEKAVEPIRRILDEDGIVFPSHLDELGPP